MGDWGYSVIVEMVPTLTSTVRPSVWKCPIYPVQFMVEDVWRSILLSFKAGHRIGQPL